MRFIGSKEKLLDNIYQAVLETGITEGAFCDFFSGTSIVGRFFKQKGYSIMSSDLLYFSYVLQKAYIENNSEPRFDKLLKAIIVNQDSFFMDPLDKVRSYLNNLPEKKGFIYNNYSEEGTANGEYLRKYFISKNAAKIDAIRSMIERWNKQGLINENEYFILLANLIESVPFYANISGVYAAFFKKYDPRALKKFELKPIYLYKSDKKHKVFNKNSMEIVDDINVDILYLDPPYNNRQYGNNYHLLETIAKYDNPEIKGVSGMRNYDHQKSDFCNEKNALISLDKVAKNAKYKYLILSYNSEGIMDKDKILSTLGKYGEVKLIELDYLRYKSNSNGDSKHKKNIQEQLFVLKSY